MSDKTPDKQGDQKTKSDAKEAAKEARFKIYEAIPKGDWEEMAAIDRAQINRDGRLTGLPVNERKINLPKLVYELHKMLAAKGRIIADAEINTPLNRRRIAQANIEEMRERELKNEFIPRDQLHDILGRLARLMRGFAEGLKKRNETEALAAYDRMLSSFKREIRELKTDE